MALSFNNKRDPVKERTFKRTSTNTAVTTKDDRQEVSILKWKEASGVGTLNLIPRFGKTRVALKIISKMQVARPSSKILVVVPNVQVTVQWRAEIQDFKLMTKLPINSSNITVITRNSFKSVSSDYNLVIYDEIHKIVATEEGRKSITLHSNIKFKLGLTGTLPTNAVERKFIEQNLPVLDTITEDEALANKWISPYDEYNVLIPFPRDAQYEYTKHSRFITETLQIFKGTAKLINGLEIYNNIFFGFKGDYEVITACLAGRKDLSSGRYIQGKEVRDIVGKSNGWKTTLNLHTPYDAQLEKYWSPSNIINRVLTFNNFIRERKELVDSHLDKLSALYDMIESDYTLPTLIYTGSVDVADEVVESINRKAGKELAIAFHSRISSRPIINPATDDYHRYKSGAKKGLPKVFGKSKLKEFYVESLKTGMHRILVTVESLNEGLNIPNLKRVISIAGSRNSITHKQRTARVKTIDEQDLSKVGKIYNVVFDSFDYKGVYYIPVDKAKLLTRQIGTDTTPVFTTLDVLKKMKKDEKNVY